MSEAEISDRYRAPALDKGLDILELLASTEEGLSQAEIAKALNRTPNEIYRMLERLVRRSFVSRTAGDRYELTLKLFVLAHQKPPIRRLVSHAIPAMRRFARDVDQSCHLVVYDRGNLVVVAQVDSPGYWSMSIRVGSRVGLFNTGSGHVFLAFASEDERRFMDEEHELLLNEARPPDLEERLAIIRKRGYELMNSAQTEGVLNLSVPVFGPNETVLAALTCPYTKRLDIGDLRTPEEVARLLCSIGRAGGNLHAPRGDTMTSVTRS